MLGEKATKFFRNVERGIEYATGGDMGRDFGWFVLKFELETFLARLC